MNNPITGLVIILAMFLQDPFLGFTGLLGLTASTLVAEIMNLDQSSIRAGLFGFNG